LLLNRCQLLPKPDTIAVGSQCLFNVDFIVRFHIHVLFVSGNQSGLPTAKPYMIL
jgi:hypothetical protein